MGGWCSCYYTNNNATVLRTPYSRWGLMAASSQDIAPPGSAGLRTANAKSMEIDLSHSSASDATPVCPACVDRSIIMPSRCMHRTFIPCHNCNCSASRDEKKRHIRPAAAGPRGGCEMRVSAGTAGMHGGASIYPHSDRHPQEGIPLAVLWGPSCGRVTRSVAEEAGGGGIMRAAESSAGLARGKVGIVVVV